MSKETISFKFRNIDILEFSFVHPKQIFPENAVFRFETQIEHKVNLEEKFIIVVSSFIIHCENLSEKVGNAVVSCVYTIDNIEDFVNENKVFTLPEQLLTMFNSISISTCRGVLFTLFRGTPLHTVILPIINPVDLNKQQP
ncbi:MAG TPA: hypothetical protein PKH58_10680 [Paludibacteraceae bacterium]|jgi:hypothetical protein|nr:hypothetical protein [Paludibacteraceae bacterium]